jgi:hypothetical protein
MLERAAGNSSRLGGLREVLVVRIPPIVNTQIAPS